MREFFGVLGRLSEHGVVKIAGYAILGFLGLEGIACLSGYDLEISRQGFRCQKHTEGHLPIQVCIIRSQESA